jgi:hypothetical protein
MRVMKKRIEEIFSLLVLAALTFLVFWPCLWAGFLNWDDPAHLTQNPFLPLHGFGDVIALFMHPDTVNGTYIPLTVLSFGIERSVWGLNPFVFHFNNILLHAVAAGLIFVLARRLGISVKAAFVAALVFAVHPMRVESVAWITERKDVLFGVFYLGAMIAYIDYVRSGRFGWYVAAFVCAILSILSKPMALSLPFILFLMDWMVGRRWSMKVLWDKVPFMLVLWPVAMISATLSIEQLAWKPAELFLVAAFSSTFYVINFVWPLGFEMIYLTPKPVTPDHPAYGMALGGFLVCFILGWIFRRDRWVVFAGIFYMASIFFVWQIAKSASIIVAERFMYIPCVGFVLLIGVVWDRVFFQKNLENKRAQRRGWMAAACLFAVLTSITFTRCWAWQDSLTLWNEVLRGNPRDASAYVNRAAALITDLNIRQKYGLSSRECYVLAHRDFQRAVALAPRDEDAWHNLSVTLHSFGKKTEAKEAQRRAEQLGWHSP